MQADISNRVRAVLILLSSLEDAGASSPYLVAWHTNAEIWKQSRTKYLNFTKVPNCDCLSAEQEGLKNTAEPQSIMFFQAPHPW